MSVLTFEGETRGAFLTAMHSGEKFETDEKSYWYFLEVLPPVYMARTVTLPDGQTVQGAFGFAEGAEPITAFWKSNGRYYGCRTNTINPCW